MIQIIKSDLYKSKRSMLGYLILLIPGVTIIYEIINFLLRRQTLENLAVEMHTDLWHVLLDDKQLLLSLAIPLGLSIMASIVANIEHQSNSWKQLLAMPISRNKVYLSKCILLWISFMGSSILLFVGMLLFGALFDLGETPYIKVLSDSFLPILSSLPLLAIQLWLSLVIKNQAYPILIGTVSSVVGLFCSLNPTLKWLPWAYPILSTTLRMDYDTNQIVYNSDLSLVLSLSLGIGLLLIACGSYHFSRKEVY